MSEGAPRGLGSAGPQRLAPLSTLGRFLSPYRGKVLIAAAALVFTAAATLSLGWGLKVLIDEGFARGTERELAQAALLLLAIATTIAAGTFLRFYLMSWLGERVSADLRKAVFDNLLRQDPAFFDSNAAGDIMSRLTTDTSLLQTIVGSSLSLALRNALTLIGALVLMFVTNVRLSLIIAISVPLILVPILVFGRRIRRLSTRSQDSIANVGSYAGEVIQNIRVVQGFNRESYESGAFAGTVEQAFSIARSRVLQRAVLLGAAMLLLFGGLIAMLWTGGSDVIAGRMTPGELGAFAFYAVMVGTGFATVAEVWGELLRAAGAAERLLELLAARPGLSDGAQEPGAARPVGMRLRGVRFSYPARPRHPALDGLDLEIEAGRSLALVGPSGAGKSTVFQLLQRFYDPDAGSIELGGIDLRALPRQALRSLLALVPQEPVLFTGDVRHNIAYGRQGATKREIEEAARQAHAHEFIARLPDGYDTHLGERGVQLSGGQRQRLALARAVLRDPAILLLDEATSALDAESEYQVQQALGEVMRGRTTIIIAHRLATIRDADRIAIFDRGRVVGTGRHEELLQSSPLYARLASLQFRDEVTIQPGGPGAAAPSAGLMAPG